jgi:hypothetical protein
MRFKSVFGICSLSVFVFAAATFADSSHEPKLVYPQTQGSGKQIGTASVDISNRTYGSATHPQGPFVSRAEKADRSLPLDWMPLIYPAPAKISFEVPNRPLPPKGGRPAQSFRDPVIQDQPFAPDVTPAIPATTVNFEGLPNSWSVYPPDTNGAVGANHYVQTVNLGFAIWNKNGTIARSVSNTNTLWSGFGAPCETQNNGDPIVLHDQIADRWLISQFALPSSGNYQCIAISQTSNPTGAYYRYAFLWSATLMNDYPHFGVWPDGYYMSANEFLNRASFAGAGAGAFERDKMLVGDPNARLVVFHQINDGGQLATDLDGSTLPPAGTPNFFADWETNAFHIWKFHVDWNNTANSTFTNFAQISVAAFDSSLGCSGRSCIPQPGTTVKVDAITDRYMFRLAYRNFGSYQSLVTNHTVDATGGNIAGVRWYEVRSPNSSPFVYQQGTYSPDSNHRWMGSAAMDQSGDIALGYSVSSSSVFPSIRYTGRLVSDPVGTMPQGEAVIQTGSGSQTGSASRWGDYSALSIDPVDDCTFWYTTEYYSTTSAVGWRTRIASFKFPSCGGGGGGCTAPSGFANNTATDISNCADTGVQITWSNPSSWGDTSGTRTHDVLRNGVVIASGLSAATTTYTDNGGVNGTTYTYTVRHNNGCGLNATTTGASAADNISAPPVNQTATQSGTLTAKNNTVTAALNPAFTATGPTSANISWTLGGNTTLTACTAVFLRAPGGTQTTLKAAGQANPGSANVLSFYTTYGPGTYTIVLQELANCGLNKNRNATLSGTSMTVQKPGTCN